MNKKITFYTVLTTACLFFDGIALVVSYARFSAEGADHLEPLLVLEVLCYMCLNAALPLLFLTSKFNSSPHLFDFITDALLGATSTMHDRIKTGFNEIKTKQIIKKHGLDPNDNESGVQLKKQN